MENISINQRQQLIDLKNRLKEEAENAYVDASIEEIIIEEKLLLKESEIKGKLYKEIENIIYNQK